MASLTQVVPDDRASPRRLRGERPDVAERQARLAIGLFLVTTALVFAVAPGALNYLFPALALPAAVFLFARSRATYVGFVFWLYFLSPELRRLVDFRTVRVELSPLLLAPVFATMVSGYVLATRPRALARRGALPFGCALAGVLFGAVVGLVHYPPFAVGRALLNWIPPILFGFFLYADTERYAEYRGAIERALLYGTLLLGAYGAIQFFVLPAWDQRWMVDMGYEVFGEPAPMKIRVFSTMNVPATFATYMMAGLLMLLSLKTRVRYVAAPLGFLALILTTSRSSWIGLVAGLVYLTFRLKTKERIRILAAVLVCVLLTAASTVIPQVNEMVTTRIRSLTDPRNDLSLNARVDGYREAFAALAVEPFGEGLGSADTDHATTGKDDRLGPHDSTVLELLFSLGGPGSAVYGLGILIAVILVGRAGGKDPFSIAMAAIFVGYAAEFLLNSILLGVLGFMVWTALGMSLASAERARVRSG